MTVQETLMATQRGLPMPVVFGQIVTIVNLKDHEESTKQELKSLVTDLARDVSDNHQDCGLVAMFNPELWGKWHSREIVIKRDIIDRKIKFSNTGGDVVLFIKAREKGPAAKILDKIKPRLENLVKDPKNDLDILEAGRRRDMRVASGTYNDGITNPNDPISLTEDVLVNAPSPDAGASYAFTQKFVFDWARIDSQSGSAQDEMFGRNPDGASLPQHATFSHIHRAHVKNRNQGQLKILRQGLSFGIKKGHAGREKGIMFVSFCNEQPRFEKILDKLLGEEPTNPLDKLMDVVKAESGGYWYVPSAEELKVPSVRGRQDVPEDDHWNIRSPNGYMFYNSQDWLHQMSEGRYKSGDPPSDRILSLMSRSFSHWRDGWMDRRTFPRLPSLLKCCKDENPADIMAEPVPVRKGLANFHSLGDLLSDPKSKLARYNGLLRILPKELIVGVIPDFTLGRGKEVMPYLSEEETMKFWFKASLNEWSSMGHIVPNFEVLVQKGLGELLKELKAKEDKAKETNEPKAVFYRSAYLSIEGVQEYMRNWKALADNAADETANMEDKANMEDVSQRFAHLVANKPRDFQDAVQLIYSMHCCLHLVGELTAMGRLDQILWPFLEADVKAHPEKKMIIMERAQEIIDCLFIKIGDNAFVNRAFIYDYLTFGTTTINGHGGNFPQGGGINQWVQQITVGGYKALDGDSPVGGANDVTMLFLKAARRLPVNAPTVSLRVYKDMPDEYLDEAAKGILSGGAQPILYNDDKLTEGLYRSGKGLVSRAWSRNYAADGCYEPMFAGASEFVFGNVEPMLALEQALNEGAQYGAAGPVHLRGMKQTFRGLPASKLTTFELLKKQFLEQVEWLMIKTYDYMISNYGNLAPVCPSPLLSVFIDGCVDKGLDLTSGGALFHIMAPLCVGVSNTVDSLYSIKKLVYDPESAMTTLADLVDCLINDWGFNMIEPFQDGHLGPATTTQYAVRYKRLRDAALSLPKWGSGDPEVNELGDWLIKELVDLCVKTIDHPLLAPGLQRIRDAHGQDFEFVITPGIGTFEGYVGDGIPCGASADGRRSGMPIASDLSPTPAPQDLPPMPAFRNIYQAMESCKSDAVEYGISNASPVDMNIDEHFPLDKLQKFVKDYAQGTVGSNLITITCANPMTYQKAVKDTEKYNLVRVRMGGWTEFYATMFPAYQEQQQRRQYYTPGKPEATTSYL